jgi:hypothetical protein
MRARKGKGKGGQASQKGRFATMRMAAEAQEAEICRSVEIDLRRAEKVCWRKTDCSARRSRSDRIRLNWQAEQRLGKEAIMIGGGRGRGRRNIS